MLNNQQTASHHTTPHQCIVNPHRYIINSNRYTIKPYDTLTHTDTSSTHTDASSTDTDPSHESFRNRKYKSLLLKTAQKLIFQNWSWSSNLPIHFLQVFPDSNIQNHFCSCWPEIGSSYTIGRTVVKHQVHIDTQWHTQYRPRYNVLRRSKTKTTA
jgi:hypothetical protein